MLRFVTKRLLALVPLLLLLTVVAFALVQLAPGDPARIILGPDASPAAVERLRAELGLDRPLLIQYVSYLADVARFDFGVSPVTGEDVTTLVARRLARTATIGAYALVLTTLLSIPLGTIAAVWRNRWPDRVTTGGAILLMAVPSFVLAALLVSYLAVGGPGWFPPTGYVAPTEDLAGWLHHATLPAIAIATAPLAELVRQARGSMIDALEEDYVRTARAKGLSPLSVVAKHAAKNASVPYVTILGLNAGRVLGMTVIVEQIFNIRGFGLLGVETVLQRDFPTLQAVVLVSGVVMLVANLAVDLSYGFLNPKVRTR